jgi:hypothetical protein
VVIIYTAGTFVQTLTETLTVPSTAPYILTPTQEATLLGVTSLLNGVTPVANTFVPGGPVTVASALAGESLTLTYSYGLPPNAIVLAILFLVAHWYQSREAATDAQLAELPFGVKSLLAPYLYTAFGF